MLINDDDVTNKESMHPKVMIMELAVKSKIEPMSREKDPWDGL